MCFTGVFTYGVLPDSMLSVPVIKDYNQFGFKRKLGTDTCIYVLKEIVDKYRSLNGCICMCFLDASKAFDRVQYSVLFAKLVRRGVPMHIVKLLCYWYSHQTMCFRWGGVLSDNCCVSNGVRTCSMSTWMI